MDPNAPGRQPYNAYGSGTTTASDQAYSFSDAQWRAGVKAYFDPDFFYREMFPVAYNITDKSNFPGFQGSNHMAKYMMGPPKDDWTKACPLEWSLSEREEKCISIQETIYGTKTLRQLEAIKEALDPDYMYDCNGCIRNNRVKDAPDTPSLPAESRLSPPLLRGQLIA